MTTVPGLHFFDSSLAISFMPRAELGWEQARPAGALPIYTSPMNCMSLPGIWTAPHS
jgi:hypothetical protein